MAAPLWLHTTPVMRALALRGGASIATTMPRASGVGRRMLSSATGSSDDEAGATFSQAGAETQPDTGPHRETENADGIKVQILEAALEHVHMEGWTTHALSKGAVDAGFSSATHGLFPRGPVELVDHFANESNLRLSSQMLMMNPEEEGTTESEFVETALRTRLEMIIPYRETWAEALAILMHPSNAVNSMRTAGMMLDDVCYQAGDQSRDGVWYAKRAGLASVYGSTELFLLQDTTPDNHATWAFLTRRMKDLESMRHKHSDVGTVGTMAGSIAKTIFEQMVLRR